MPVTFYTGTVPSNLWPTQLTTSNQMLTIALSNSSVTANVPAWTCTNSQTQSSGCNSKNSGSCTYTYYRTVSFLSVANMQVQLPDSCSTGPCTPSQLIASGCSLVYVPSTPVSSKAAVGAELTSRAY